mgnify:CR=1 FL=1
MRKSFVASLMAVVLIAAFAATSLACTSIPVSKGASAGGYVMTTWTDDSGSDNTRINVVPAKDWPAGTMRTVLRNTDYGQFEQIATPIFSPGVIPQVEHTYQYINASYSFMNENGVGMGETTIGGSSKMRNTKGWFDIVELQRIALERSKTAREAVLIMGELAEKYGVTIFYTAPTAIRSLIKAAETNEAVHPKSYDLSSLRLGGPLRFFPAEHDILHRLADRMTIDSALACYNEINQARRVAQHPLNARLFLEDMLLRYARAFARSAAPAVRK